MDQHIYIDGSKMPLHLQANIMARFMTETELRWFFKKYIEHKKSLKMHEAKPPTEKELEMAKAKKAGMTYKEIGVKFGILNTSVQSIIQRVAVWEYMHK